MEIAMGPLKINLAIAKTNPEPLYEFFKDWLTRYEAARRSATLDQSNDPEVISTNANALAKSVALSIDSAFANSANQIAREVSKQAFAIGMGRSFPETNISIALPHGYEATSTVSELERVQTIERDPETQEILRTTTK
jgi:hypothetical protein